MLFELLTGELPFRGTAEMLIFQIQRDEPPRPRRLNARVPRDLETITLKCLEKEPSKRYQTAVALSADLRHWLDGKPIQARPAGRTEGAWRWCKRNPVVASLSAAVALALTVGMGASTYFAVLANTGVRAAEVNLDEATRQRERAEKRIPRGAFRRARSLKPVLVLPIRCRNS